MNDVIEGEFTTGSHLAVQAEKPALPSLFNQDDPVRFIEHATKIANALVAVIEAKGLSKSLNRQKPEDKFVELEGWQLLGSMNKIYAVIEWTKEREDGWEARAQAFTVDGALVGAGEAVCLKDEANWRGKPSYALKGMAQTRAMSRALRAPLGFIMTLAGYKATGAEEIPREEPPASPAPAVAPPLDPQKATTFQAQLKMLAGELGWNNTTVCDFIAHTLGDDRRSLKGASEQDWIAVVDGMSARVNDLMAEEAHEDPPVAGEVTHYTPSATMDPDPDRQGKRLFAMLKDHGIGATGTPVERKAERIAFAKKHGIEVDSYSQLTPNDKHKLICALEVMSPVVPA